MSALAAITQDIISQMPPATRFQPGDAQTITAQKDFLLSLEPAIVQGFYDTLYAHSATRAIFSDGERPDREETLRQWWRRTVGGPFDSTYWEWQALVGLIHVRRKVKNVMMISMWGWVLQTLRDACAGRDGSEALMASFERLAATVQSLTAESYLEHYIKALQEATGFERPLMERLVANEVEDLVASARN